MKTLSVSFQAEVTLVESFPSVSRAGKLDLDESSKSKYV